MLQEGEKSLSHVRNQTTIPWSSRPYPHLYANWTKPAPSSCLKNWLKNNSFVQHKPRIYIAGYNDKYTVNLLFVANVYVLLSFTQLLYEEENRKTARFKSNLVYFSVKYMVTYDKIMRDTQKYRACRQMRVEVSLTVS